MSGLGLPDKVLQKHYYQIALALFPSIDEQLFIEKKIIKNGVV